MLIKNLNLKIIYYLFDQTFYNKIFIIKPNKKLNTLDTESNTHFVPHVIEPAVGVDRILFAILCSAYDVEEIADGEKRTLLHLPAAIAAVQIAILPLSKKEELKTIAQGIATVLRKSYRVEYDETQSIGKRYRRQDEIGTPYCITVDFDSLDDNSVTIRDRDTMKQERINITALETFFKNSLGT